MEGKKKKKKKNSLLSLTVVAWICALELHIRDNIGWFLDIELCRLCKLKMKIHISNFYKQKHYTLGKR